MKLKFIAFAVVLAVCFSCSKDKNDSVKPASWEVISTAQGLLSNETNCVFGASDNTVWVGTDKGVSHFDGQKWTNYTIQEGSETYGIRDISEDVNGNIVVATYWNYYGYIATGVYKFNGNGFEEYLNGDVNGSLFIFMDSKSRQWFLRSQGGISYVKDGEITRFTEADGLVSNSVYCIAEDKAGNIWIGTFYGLSKWDGTGFTNYTTDNGLLTDRIEGITVDISGNIWLAQYESYGGATKFDGQNFTHYGDGDGAGHYCESIHATSDGCVWIGTTGSDEVYKYKNGTWKTYTDHFNYNYSNYLNDIREIGDDLWFCVNHTGVVVYRNFKNEK